MSQPNHGFTDWQNPQFTADLDSGLQSPSINAGIAITGPVFDMRPFQQFNLVVTAQPHALPATGYGWVQVNLRWWADVAQTILIHQRTFSFFPETATVAFLSTLGRVMCQGAIRGPFLTITIYNGGTDQIDTTYEVWGTTRPVGGEFLINTKIAFDFTSSFDTGWLGLGVLNLNPAAQVNAIWPIAQGPLTVSVGVTQQPVTIDFINPAGQLVETIFLTVIGTFQYGLSFPWSAIRARIINNAAAIGNFSVQGGSPSRQWG